MPITLLSYHISQSLDSSPEVKISFFDDIDSAIDDVVNFLNTEINYFTEDTDYDVSYKKAKLKSDITKMYNDGKDVGVYYITNFLHDVSGIVNYIKPFKVINSFGNSMISLSVGFKISQF